MRYPSILAVCCKLLLQIASCELATTWKLSVESLVCGPIWWLGTTTSSDSYIPEAMDPEKISGTYISYMKSLDNYQALIELQSFTNHRTSIVSLFRHLTAQQNLCLNSLPESCLPLKGNYQICHQSYTIAQESSKCGSWRQLWIAAENE